jgi:transcriptional antiterminator NusG
VRPRRSRKEFAGTVIKPELIFNELNKKSESLSSSYPLIYLLHYGDYKKNIAMHERGHIFFERLLNVNYCIVGSKSVIVENELRITEGSLIGLECQIGKINRHQRKAYLNVEFANKLREVRLTLEITEKSGGRA